MLNGEHYLFRKQSRTFYVSGKNEREASIMAMVLKPWYCEDALARNRTMYNDTWLDSRCVLNRSSQITIFNRKRDQFSFLVGAGL